jgi:predicted dinucleotide-binding enzyme
MPRHACRGGLPDPNRAALFCATDDDVAGATAERLIKAAGFDPLTIAEARQLVA